MYLDREEMPKVFSAKNIAIAVVLHGLLFAFLWYMGVLGPDGPKETIIPIELSFVLHENLDGVEDEPPPEAEPTPGPEPEHEPVAEPDPPPPPPPVPEESVVQVPEEVEKPEPPKPPEEPKKVEPPRRPDPPKKTPEQIRKEREERLKKMRESMTKVKDPPPGPRHNGRTEKRPPNWRELLTAGYEPSNHNAGLDASESQRCISLIHDAFYSKWNRPAWTPELKRMSLQVTFDRAGNVTGYRFVARSGDRRSDDTVLEAASRVGRVAGLSLPFLESINMTVTINFDVKPM